MKKQKNDYVSLGNEIITGRIRSYVSFDTNINFTKDELEHIKIDVNHILDKISLKKEDKDIRLSIITKINSYTNYLDPL